MEQKVRFKMHKVKKNWVTIGVTALSMVTVAGGTLLADQQVQADEQNPANQSGDSSQDLLQETPATTNDAATTVAPTIAADANTASVNIPVADTTSTTTAVTDRAAAPTTNVATVDTNSGQAAPSTNVQPAAADTSATTTDTNTNAAVTGTDRATATTDRSATTDTANTEARTRSRRALAETREANTNTATGIQWINGKQYYVNSDGSVRKNFVFEQDGKSYYFDAETGALATKSQDEFSTEPIKAAVDFSSGNQLYKNDNKSLDQLDSFITADAWYRPKSILKDGKTWTASTEADKRPLLMVWWPDKSTQVNYLNYMQNQGLGAGSFSTNSSQESLDQAAKAVQTKIEERIAREGNTNWLRTSIDQFIKTQPGWNSSTENSSYDHLQGGQLLFNNSKGDTGNRTSNANSDYRLLNRTPTNQTGTRKYFKDNSIGGLEFLLANDIDNSNPAVQAEQLNWLHFMMNIGSIMANDPTANFDGLRVDALDNVDADLLQIASDYFKAAYGVDKSEANAIKHLSYLEAWSANDPYYNKDTKGAQLPIDNALRNALTNLLMRDKNTRMQLGDMTAFINSSLNPRGANDKNGERMANYIFTRAHDTEAQTIIQRIIRDRINPNLFGYNFTRDEIKKAFEIYNEDIDKAHKTYASYNLPSVYALMLTNKDSVTRVYYGDLYREDGHYMAKKTPYFDAIDTLLRARIKYVAGGQDMEVKKVGNDGLLTSVRYGKGANNRTDLGTSETRTQGMGVIMTNNYDFRLGSNETVTMNMGRAHRNQLYRPLLLTTKDGIATYFNDSDVPKNLLKRTDWNGNLTFNANDIFGVENVQVSGYLGVWVPVGAKANQDARTQPSNRANSDGQVYKSSAALDSQVMYEAFSNFQAFADDQPELYMNRVLAKNTDLLKAWGITSVGLPPQYVSSKDGTFLDSTIDNGYAFDDRYDMALSQNNKYGSLEDLLNVLRALHKDGIQAIADWVPDQIYNLPGKEVVNATRVNGYGNHQVGYQIIDQAYVANTRTDGTDYQGKYGGAFLDELKAKYPSIFNRVQISNGKQLPTNEKITKWSAKYFNGTNILGRGINYVLRDDKTNQYFNTSANSQLLPTPLRDTGAITSTQVFQRRGQDVYFLRDNQTVKNEFVQDGNGNWYYFGGDGKMTKGAQNINNKDYYFFDNGVQLRNALRRANNGYTYYYGLDGAMVKNAFVDFDDKRKQVRAFTTQGTMVVGNLHWSGHHFYFDRETGLQAKDRIVRTDDGKLHYYAAQTGDMGRNVFATDSSTGKRYYFDADGNTVTGSRVIDGKTYYFNQDGSVGTAYSNRADSIIFENGKARYITPAGEIGRSIFVYNPATKAWNYFDKEGNRVTGRQYINGHLYYFKEDGSQAKGEIIEENGIKYYYEPESGILASGRYLQVGDDQWMYFKHDGSLAIGQVRADHGYLKYFDKNGIQVKGKTVVEDGKTYYYDAHSGALVTSSFAEIAPNQWSYFNTDGQALKGKWTINGKEYYFDQNGIQYKGKAVKVGSRYKYYDENDGQPVTNRFAQIEPNVWAYFGADGYAVTGEQVINGQHLYFDQSGRQVKGAYVTVNGQRRYYDANTGEYVPGR